jgi:hypothetical protein
LVPIVLSALATVFPHPMPVVCQMPPGHRNLEGAMLRDDRVNVRRYICLNANQLVTMGEITAGNARAIDVLAHEQEHFRHPWGGERQTECRALADVAPIVRAILPHDTPEQRQIADMLARTAYLQARAASDTLPSAYLSSCNSPD